MNSLCEQAEIGDHPSPKPQTPKNLRTPADPPPDQVPRKYALHSNPLDGDQNQPEPPSTSGYQDKPVDRAPILTEEVGACSYFELFKKGDRSTIVLVVLGHIFAAGQGVMRGLIGYVIGNSVGVLTAENSAGLTKVIPEIVLKSVFFGIATMVFATISKYIWTRLQNTLSQRVKFLYFSKVLEKDMGWYDRMSPEKITSQYNIDSLAY